MTHVTCRLTAKNQDQLWNSTLGNRVWATFTFLLSSEEQQKVAKLTVLSIVSHDARRYFNVHSKADISQLNLVHRTNN